MENEKTMSVENRRKKKWRREPSHNSRFIAVALVALLVILAVILIAKFTTLKTLFWLE